MENASERERLGEIERGEREREMENARERERERLGEIERERLTKSVYKCEGVQ